MRHIQATICLLLITFFMMTSAQAHDPSEHLKKNEAPKCESMKTMDHSKLDANGPVMMAMMKKCKAQAHKEGTEVDHSNMEMDHSNMEMDHNNMEMDHSSMEMDHSSMEGMPKSTAGGHYNDN